MMVMSVKQDRGGMSDEDMSDCPNHPSLQDEPLPYCDLVDTNVQACSDRYDYDE